MWAFFVGDFMAIQTINLTVPGGDTPRSANTKINANFSDTTHAASRLVGTASGNVVEMVGKSGVAGTGWGGGNTYPQSLKTVEDRKSLVASGIYRVEGSGGVVGIGTAFSPLLLVGTQDTFYTLSVNYTTGEFEVVYGTKSSVLQQDEIPENRKMTLYTTKNTTVDSNKNIKTSSPVVRVFSDHLDKIHEANDLPIKYTRNGVGDYTIEGTTGLRENDWQIVIPKDDHDNQLIAFTLEDDNGTIHLKAYKRTFSMQTFTFGPDLEAPMDIPEGRWVDLHFNDLPQEHLYDIQTEV